MFRIAFGLILCVFALGDLASGRVHADCVAPRFHFSYFGCDWIQPLPGAGMHLLFLVLFMCGLGIALGLCYRASAACAAVAFTYFFLLDRTFYQNHYYLLTLIAWWLALLPLNRCWSMDVVNGLAPSSETVPAWWIWVIRFHVGLPYFFGGIAKLEPDWMSGLPMRSKLESLTWCAENFSSQVLMGSALVLTWGGIVFDLAIVPLLMWRRTRAFAYGLCVVFHLTNALLFPIHIFPWFMILATTVFFEPAWSRRLLRRDKAAPPLVRSTRTMSFLGRGALITGLSVYGSFHCLWPLRHLLNEQPTGWTERGHYFAWRMMLRGKTTGLQYFVTDMETGQTTSPDIYQFISEEQSSKSARDPEMILHLAHFLAEQHRAATGHRAEVRVLALCSLNGRKPQLLIDPLVNLAAEPRGFHHRDWIVPLTEPLPTKPWSVPLAEWPKHVELPDLPFVDNVVRNTSRSALTGVASAGGDS